MLLAVLARHSQLPIADHEVYVATVGGIETSEPAADLGIALALASATRELPIPATVCAIGEVSLSGDVRRVPVIGRRLAEAARLGFTTALVPASHVGEAIAPGANIRVIPVATIGEALTAVSNLSRHTTEDRRPVLRPVSGGARP
jgi:DNA repair protein RadA/Sms